MSALRNPSAGVTGELRCIAAPIEEYDHLVIHVTDASRSVGVLSEIMKADGQIALAEKTKKAYADVRESRAAKGPSNLLSIERARGRRESFDWQKTVAPAPALNGLKVFDDYPLDELADRIDWSPFFTVWELKGRYPAILKDPVYGKEATRVFDDAL